MTSTISRRQILSRSRDAGLDAMQKQFAPYEDYEEMWFSHEQLFKDHIAEVLRKWDQIDDEIWAKMIFMSRNRRIAKAYVRVPAVIINGTDDGFDGFKVGLNGFDDPFRDAQTDELMSYIDECRIGIDDSGNMIIKRYTATSGVYIKSYPMDFSESVVSNPVIKCKGSLEVAKPYVIFDMTKFETAMARELQSAYPDRRRLEQQCIVVVAFVRNHPTSILDLPIYVMFINIVALDLLKSKLNPVIYQSISHRALPPSHGHPRAPSGAPRNGTLHPGPIHGGGAPTGRVNGRNEGRMRVPDFVSIFAHQSGPSGGTGRSPQGSEDDDFDEDDETIYGRIGDDPYGGYACKQRGGVSDDYISDYEYRRFRPPQNSQRYGASNGGFNPSHSRPYNDRANPASRNSYPFPAMSTIRSIRPGPLPPLPRSEPFHAVFDSHDDSLEPPKLPPRDKKKLSKQINTIKKSRSGGLNNNPYRDEDPYEIQIPSPDYGPEETALSSFSGRNVGNKENRPKSWSPLKGGVGQQSINRNARYIVAGEDRDHIYDTMTRSRSMVIAPKGAPTRNGPNTIRMTASTVQLPPVKGQGSHRPLPPPSRLIEDEDPYYSGLEARLSSKKILGGSGDGVKGSKGLGAWMMRKVNMLTSKRQKAGGRKGAKGSASSSSSSSHRGKGSSADSSTDSDPYASINEVYEPIYGYTTAPGVKGGAYSNPLWPTMQRTSKKH